MARSKLAFETRPEKSPVVSFSNWVLGGPLIVSGGRSISCPSRTSLQSKQEAKKDAKDEKSIEVPKDEKIEPTMSGAKNDETSKDEKSNLEKECGCSGREWMKQQDKRILEMKRNNKSWMDIAIAVQRNKHEVRARFKELIAEEEEKKRKKEAAVNASPLNINLDNDPEFAAFQKLYMIGTDNKDTSKPTCNYCNHNHDASTERRASFPSPPPFPSSWDQHTWNQRPATKFLRPNFIWSQEDCETLEMLEEQYVEQKWLQLQAKFFNWTGRMIPAELIQKKFEDDRGY
ncbi:hypothetical protein B7463_g2412, partial [Scytalidium lignicola]